MVKSRRAAREAALRAMYGMEIAKRRLADALAEMALNADLPPDLLAFAKQLLEGVNEKQAFLDDVLSSVVMEYDFDRIAFVDRNLLRIAAYEIYFCPIIPPAVSINEAIELAKKYSTADSGRFVNGVLGGLLVNSPKAIWTAPADHEDVEEATPPESPPEIETIDENAPEAEEALRFGKWQVRSGKEH